MNKTEASSETKTPESPAVRNRMVAMGCLLGGLVLATVAHGALDGRWSQNVDLKAQGGRLQDFPETVDDWDLVESSQLDEQAADLLRCYGSTVRTYRQQGTGFEVNIAVMFGPRGPIAVHTPEVCYTSVGTEPVGDRKAQRVRAGDVEHSLWSTRFAVAPLPTPVLEVWYGWSDGGPWEARSQPRFWLTDNLYKIQAAGPVGDETQRPLNDFMRKILPELERLIGEAKT